MPDTPDNQPPKVFISYSHDSPDHANRVLDLADTLRANGLSAIIDQYDPNPDQGWPAWMTDHLTTARFILMICSPTYHRRVMRQEPAGVGLGVQWEGKLIFNLIYNDSAAGSRFIPILLDGATTADIPLPVAGHTRYELTRFDIDDPKFEALIRHLTTQPATPPPNVGTIPSLPPSPRQIADRVAPKQSDLSNTNAERDSDKTTAEVPKYIIHISGGQGISIGDGNSQSNQFGKPRSDLEDPEVAPAKPKLWNVPYPRNPFFTGREDILSQLQERLLPGKTAALNQAIRGLGGIGKTQTAVEYAHRYCDEYAAVLWLNAASEETVTAGFSELARLLELPEAAAQDQSVSVAAVKRWLGATTGWLLILDNADDLAIVRQSLPTVHHGRVLITTRAAAMGGIAEPLNIGNLLPEEGALLLLRRAGILKHDAPISTASEEDHANALAIATELGGLPLALDQAGAYIEEMPSTLQRYRKLYQTRRAALLKERGNLGGADHESVTVTFSLAFEKVESLNPASADLLRLCAMLAPDAIPIEILTKGHAHLGDILSPAVQDEIASDKAIKDAHRWSLLDCDSKSETLILHRVAQAVIQETMGDEPRRAWAGRAVLALNAVFPNPEFANWPRCDRLTPHVQAALDWVDLFVLETAESARLLNQAGVYLKDRAQYAAAESLYKRALEIYEKTLGPDDPSTAASLNNLAGLYRAKANYAAAEPLHKRALDICEKTQGPDHQDTAIVLNNLAELYREQGNYTAAEQLYKRALAIKERTLGPDHPSTATSFNNLAGLYYKQGNYAAAEPLYKRALAVCEKALRPDHPDTAGSLNNLAGLYQAQRNYAAAEPLYKRVLAICEKALGPDHPDLATSLNNLATLYQDQGDYIAAERLHNRAITIREKALGPDHPNTGQSLNNLATLYCDQGDYAAAEPLYKRALAIREKTPGPDHPDTANSLSNLAGLYRAQGNSVAAEPLYKRALGILNRALGADHPVTKTVRGNLDALPGDDKP